MNLGESHNHYHYASFLQRARETASTGFDALGHEDDTHKLPNRHPPRPPIYFSPQVSCLQVSLTWDSKGSVRALLDMRGVPIVFIQAVDRFNQQFHLTMSLKDFLHRTSGISNAGSSNDDDLLDYNESVVQDNKRALEQLFLCRTPQICAHIYAQRSGKLVWLDRSQLKQYQTMRPTRAAITIQSIIRGQNGRIRVQARKFRRNSVAVQRAWLKEREFVRSLNQNDVKGMVFNGTEDDHNSAAIVLQKNVKRHQLRFKIQYKKKVNTRKKTVP
jgi:hypothetical protein